jgi:hypothetical protein
MSRVVVCETAPYDVFVGRGRCPLGGERSRWAIPPSVSGGSRAQVAVWYRAWLRSEITAGRADLAELASLHRKVLGVRRASECCYAVVLEEAAMWALAEQARRLERRLAELKDARRAGARG